MSVPFRPSDPWDRHVPDATADPTHAAPDPPEARLPAAPPAFAEPAPQGDAPDDDDFDEPPPDAPRLSGRIRQPNRRPGRRLARPPEAPDAPLTAEQRLLLLDAWRRSGLPAGDFAPLVGLSKHTLYDWKRRFAGRKRVWNSKITVPDAFSSGRSQDKPRGAPRGSRLPEVAKRAILMMKQDNPDWGCERISALLLRGPALPASPQAVAHVLHEAGYRKGTS
ncbi:MAG TPA: hypothetical protein VMS17_08570 [Gemmataceae bacterium]|nr:hypothetical protein [Gemmataceae bacterium]